jgi:hypothetical protein
MCTAADASVDTAHSCKCASVMPSLTAARIPLAAASCSQQASMGSTCTSSSRRHIFLSDVHEEVHAGGAPLCVCMRQQCATSLTQVWYDNITWPGEALDRHPVLPYTMHCDRCRPTVSGSARGRDARGARIPTQELALCRHQRHAPRAPTSAR